MEGAEAGGVSRERLADSSDEAERVEADGALGTANVTVANGAQLLVNSSYTGLPAVQSSGNVTVAWSASGKWCTSAP